MCHYIRKITTTWWKLNICLPNPIFLVKIWGVVFVVIVTLINVSFKFCYNKNQVLTVSIVSIHINRCWSVFRIWLHVQRRMDSRCSCRNINKVRCIERGTNQHTGSWWRVSCLFLCNLIYLCSGYLSYVWSKCTLRSLLLISSSS